MESRESSGVCPAGRHGTLLLGLDDIYSRHASNLSNRELGAEDCVRSVREKRLWPSCLFMSCSASNIDCSRLGEGSTRFPRDSSISLARWRLLASFHATFSPPPHQSTSNNSNDSPLVSLCSFYALTHRLDSYTPLHHLLTHNNSRCRSRASSTSSLPPTGANTPSSRRATPRPRAR